LNLAEVKLYAANGAQITPVAASISTVYDGTTDGAANTIDNNLATHCHTAWGDTRPMLNVSYSCPGGKTTAARVVVHNRDEDCCRHRLDVFSLDFVDASGQVDPRLTFSFSGSEPVYTVLGIRG
jgi:hypothetical protein